MARSGEDSRYKVWIQQAYYDIEAGKESFESKNYEWACYQAVQATEKTLKSVLIHAGWNPPMTHKLGVLVSLCNRANKVFQNIKFNFRKLEAYTFISRYPFVYPGQKNITPHEFITKQDAEVCLEIAQDVFSKIQDFFKQRTDYPTEIIDINAFYFTGAEVDQRIQEVKTQLSSADQLDIQKIILFGSFARDKTRPKTTTMDLIVIVAETEMNFIDRIAYIRELTHAGEPIIEPLVYTQKEFDYLVEEEGEGFLESAIGEGKVIYQKQ